MRARILFDQCSDFYIAIKTNKTISPFVLLLRFLPPAYRTSGTTNCMLSLWKLRKIMGFFLQSRYFPGQRSDVSRSEPPPRFLSRDNLIWAQAPQYSTQAHSHPSLRSALRPSSWKRCRRRPSFVLVSRLSRAANGERMKWTGSNALFALQMNLSTVRAKNYMTTSPQQRRERGRLGPCVGVESTKVKDPKSTTPSFSHYSSCPLTIMGSANTFCSRRPPPLA